MAVKSGRTPPPPTHFFPADGLGVLQSIGTARHFLVEMSKTLAEMKGDETGVVGVVHWARAFVALRYIKDAVEHFAKDFNVIFEPLKNEHLPAVLEAAGVTHIPLSEGYRVGVSTKLFASIKEGQKLDAFEWLKANGLGDLIQSTVNSQTLSAALKAMIEEHNKGAPEDIFNVTYVPTTSVTVTKPKIGARDE